MKTYNELNVQEKINIKQHAMNVYGKRWHTSKPNHIAVLNELQINSILSRFHILKLAVVLAFVMTSCSGTKYVTCDAYKTHYKPLKATKHHHIKCDAYN